VLKDRAKKSATNPKYREMRFEDSEGRSRGIGRKKYNLSKMLLCFVIQNHVFGLFVLFDNFDRLVKSRFCSLYEHFGRPREVHLKCQNSG